MRVFFPSRGAPGGKATPYLLDDRQVWPNVVWDFTAERFAMLAAGFPFVLREPARDRIRGDVFLIRSTRVVRALDALEGHTGRAEGYRREIVTVLLDGGARVPCWTYIFYGAPLAEPVPGGDWLARPGG